MKSLDVSDVDPVYSNQMSEKKSEELNNWRITCRVWTMEMLPSSKAEDMQWRTNCLLLLSRCLQRVSTMGLVDVKSSRGHQVMGRAQLIEALGWCVKQPKNQKLWITENCLSRINSKEWDDPAVLLGFKCNLVHSSCFKNHKSQINFR